MELLIIIALVVLNGIFSMAEMSLVSSRKFKLENAKKKGSTGAKTALELSENPTKFLSTVQIGITLIGILLGVYSGENLTNDVAGFLSGFEPLQPYAHNIAVGTVVLFVTYLSIVLGELFPKRLGMTFPEPIAMLLAKPMKILALITSPFVWLLSFSNDILIRILGIKKTTESKVSEEEIKSIIKESAEGGEIQDIEQDIVERVFELGDRKVNSLLTYRNDLVVFDTRDDWETIRMKINSEKHSAYPVCRDGNIDDIVGIVLLKDLFSENTSVDFEVLKFVKQPLFLNENTYAYKVLERFKSEKMHYAIVVDEFGSTQGMVTMDDMIDALVGDSTEFDQFEYQIVQRNESSWLVDGQYPMLDFIRYFDMEIDEDIENQYTTVAGLMIHLNNALPNIGERIVVDGYVLEVVDKDNQRIDKIMVTKPENQP